MPDLRPCRLDVLDGRQRPGQQRTRGDVALASTGSRARRGPRRAPVAAARRWGSACRGRRQEDDIGRVRATCPDGRRQRIEVGLARDVAIDRLEVPGGIEQEQARGIRVPSLVEGDLAAKVLDLSGDAARRAGRPRPARAGRAPRRAGPPRASPTRRRGRAVPDARDRASAWPLVRAARTPRRSRRAPAPARPTLEIGGDRLIRRERRLRQVPGTAIRVRFRIGRLRQGSVHLLALGDARRSGTPPHAPMGGGTGPGSWSSIRPACSAAAAASAPRPSEPAARQRMVASPSGSAAAMSSSRRLSAGSVSSRRWKPSSMRPARGIPSGSARTSASSAVVHAGGSSRSASGLPRVSARMRSRTRGSSGPVITESRRAPASATGRPPTTSSGKPANSVSSNGSRTAMTSAIRSASSRRPTNATVCAET